MQDWSLAQFLYLEMYNERESTKRHKIIETKVTWIYQIYNGKLDNSGLTYETLTMI